jgi:anti-sigma factor RsiW
VNCEDARILLHAHLDGELDAARDLEVTRHLEGCDRCVREFEFARAMHSRLRSGEFHYAAPPELAGKVRRAIASERRASPSTAAPRRSRLRWSFVAAPLALAALLMLIVIPQMMRPSRGDLIAREVVASHVRSLMASHLMDVVSTDKHTVKPWFAGKLDFSPVVTDFASAGFPLIGGRLDYIDDRTAAAVVYRHGRHIINVFMWPAQEGALAGDTFRTLSRNGYNVESFQKDGMQCWAVSDMQASELDRFAHMIVSGASTSGTPAEPEGNTSPQ